MAMMAMTTSNSIKVKAERRDGVVFIKLGTGLLIVDLCATHLGLVRVSVEPAGRATFPRAMDLLFVVRFDMAIRICCVDGTQLSVRDMAGILFGDLQIGRVVSSGNIYVLHVRANR